MTNGVATLLCCTLTTALFASVHNLTYKLTYLALLAAVVGGGLSVVGISMMQGYLVVLLFAGGFVIILLFIVIMTPSGSTKWDARPPTAGWLGAGLAVGGSLNIWLLPPLESMGDFGHPPTLGVTFLAFPLLLLTAMLFVAHFMDRVLGPLRGH